MFTEGEVCWEGEEWDWCTAQSCPKTLSQNTFGTYRSGTAKGFQIPESITIVLRDRAAITEENNTVPTLDGTTGRTHLFRQLSWLWQKSEQAAST